MGLIDAIAARIGYLSGGALRDVVRRRRGMTLRELRDGPTPVPLAGGLDPDDQIDPPVGSTRVTS